MRRILPVALLLVTLGTPVSAVDQETIKTLLERTDVEERSRGLSSVIAASSACGFRRALPEVDIVTIRAAYAQIDMDAYLKGSQDGTLAVKKQGFKPGSAGCKAAMPTIQRGIRGIMGLAKAFREFGFE